MVWANPVRATPGRTNFVEDRYTGDAGPPIGHTPTATVQVITRSRSDGTTGHEAGHGRRRPTGRVCRRALQGEESAAMTDHGPQPVERELPTEEARDLISLVRELTEREIRPHAAEEEAAGHFPRELFTLLSESGLLGLVYPEEFGGGDQPYEVYLQVLEELAAARLPRGLGVSVHTLACHGLARYGGKEQLAEHL